MPQPNKLHIDKLLSNVSRKYMNQEYIAFQAWPMVMVEKDSDKYRTYTRNWRIPQTLRANGGLAREWDFDISTASYLLEKHSLKGYVTDDDVINYDAADYRADMTEELTDAIYRKVEYDFAQQFTHTAFSQYVSLAATAAFAQNTTLSDPIPVFDTATSVISQNSGYKPNYAIISRDSFVAMKNHISILDRVKYTSSEMSENIIKGLIGVPQLFVANASYDTAHEGLTDSISYIFPNNYCFMGYKPPKPSALKPSSGYIFVSRQPGVKRWRVEEREAEAIEVTVKYDPVVVSPLSAYLIKDTV
jgi:hypothetical protein